VKSKTTLCSGTGKLAAHVLWPISAITLLCWPPFQEVRIQERLQCLDAGSVPSAISVMLLDEMADTCQAGGALGQIGGATPAAVLDSPKPSGLEWPSQPAQPCELFILNSSYQPSGH
jgi:hypothetical protein